jgi:saccharopine dehydrogenase (NAD+, L-lysine forming)
MSVKMKIKLGVVREGKTPPDKRVPLTPQQCVEVVKRFPDVEVFVQKSPIRAFADHEYADLGVTLSDDLSHCDILIGVKEVKIDDLIPGKTYLFFSHTFKKQPYNRKLLKAILNKKIRLVDYEVLTYPQGGRVIGFGRYAGIVGAYNGLLAFGKKLGTFKLKPANECFDRKEVEEELKKVILPTDFKLVLTGLGRVGNGAREIVKLLNIKEVSPEDFLNEDYEYPVFTHLDVEHYNATNDGSPFDRHEFFNDPTDYHSTFGPYSQKAQLYMACHFWASQSPIIFSETDAQHPDCSIKVIADISCDIDGPIVSTIRPSTIADPHYGYNPQTKQEVDFMDKNAIGVMAIDNLPCELPRDASKDFGGELIEKVFPHLFGRDEDKIIWRATETLLSGELAPHFEYLRSYVEAE